MGCDIHLYVEKKIGEEWHPFHKTESYQESWMKNPSTRDYYAYDGRNYDAFAILADVRNGRGFAGITTGAGFNPISEPRGIPEDVSWNIREEIDRWKGDGHSHSFHTVKQLIEFDWSQRTGKRGVMSAEEYEKWKDSGEVFPGHYASSVSGPNIQTIHEKDYLKLKNSGDLSPSIRYYIDSYWGVTYAEAAGEFYRVFLPRLKELAGDDPESVRIVFFFDN